MNKNINLFDGNSDSEEEEIELKTNKEYAKSYNKFREKELLKKFKDREGNYSISGSSSESDSSEDEIVNNPKFDEEFFKTLSSLKSKDPKIYDKNTTFFENTDKLKKTNENSSKKKKPLTIKDYERQVILEKQGVYEDDDSEVDGDNFRVPSPTIIQEERALKEEFKKVLQSDDESDGEFGGIFKRRKKNKEDQQKEDEQYSQWLLGEKEDIGEAGKQLDPLKQYWSNPRLSKQEKFLRDYILANGYANKDTEEIPTYEDIVGPEELSDDEKELEKQAEFEQKYNFRYEEPDKDFIKRYPRTIEASVRKIDDRRKLKRQEVKDRKLKEKQQKYQELQMLKALKKKEIEEKIQKLKEVTGNDELPFANDDLEEDFDPGAHDRRMQEIFNENYYKVDEGEEKPDCPDIEELKVEDWDNFDPQNVDETEEILADPYCEDDDFNMDCDYDPNAKQSLQDEMIDNTKDKRKRRNRKNKFMEMIKTEKPVFDPEDEKTYGEYIDEYYKMDYEDMIDDIPCRFKYVETVPNDFGLTIEEILLAKNKELNQWASLKKAVQFRPDHVERREVNMYKMKAKNEALKRKIFVSLYGPESDDENEVNVINPDKSKPENEVQVETNKQNKKKKKKKKKGVLQNDIKNTETVITCKETTPKQDNQNTNIRSNGIPEKDDKTKKKEKKSSTCESKKLEPNLEKATPKKVENKTKLELNIKNKNRNDKKGTDRTKSDIMKIKNNNPFKKKFKNDKNSETQLTDERLQAYGINPKKYHKKQNFLQKLGHQSNAKKNFKQKSK